MCIYIGVIIYIYMHNVICIIQTFHGPRLLALPFNCAMMRHMLRSSSSWSWSAVAVDAVSPEFVGEKVPLMFNDIPIPSGNLT